MTTALNLTFSRSIKHPKNILIGVLVVCSALLASMQTHAADLIDPPAISVPAGLELESVEKAIKVGLLSRGWTFENEKSGYMEGVLLIRVHEARVGISYSTDEVKIAYLDSKKLKYKVKNGQRKIHKNYNAWVNNIRRDITMELQKAAIK